jgi:hypothetical protein
MAIANNQVFFEIILHIIKSSTEEGTVYFNYRLAQDDSLYLSESSLRNVCISRTSINCLYWCHECIGRSTHQISG